MTTESQYIQTKRGNGDPSARAIARLFNTVAIAGTGTYSGVFTPPEGSHLASVQVETPVAISGTPTTVNFRCGLAAAGQQVVADVDVKAAGHVNATVVAAFDKITGLTSYFWQLVVTGGTAPAGAVTVAIDYWPPNGLA